MIVAERALIAPPPAEAAAGPEQRRRAVDLQPGLVADTPPVRLMALHGLGEALPDAAAAPAAANDPQPAVTAEDPQPAVPADGGVLSAEVDPTAIAVAAPRPPRSFPGFAELFPAAICYRVERVVTFFHPLQPQGRPCHAAAVSAVARVRRPAVRHHHQHHRPEDGVSRNIALLATSHWSGPESTPPSSRRIVDSGGRVGTGIAAACGRRRGQAAEHQPAQGQGRQDHHGADRLAGAAADPGKAGPRRARIPDPAGARDRELDLFSALLFDFDVDRLEFTWTRLRQLYEQELDRRAYQDKARASRSGIPCSTPSNWSPTCPAISFAMLCYFCFPNCDITFLDRFTRNKGSTPVERRRAFPT